MQGIVRESKEYLKKKTKKTKGERKVRVWTVIPNGQVKEEREGLRAMEWTDFQAYVHHHVQRSKMMKRKEAEDHKQLIMQLQEAHLN